MKWVDLNDPCAFLTDILPRKEAKWWLKFEIPALPEKPISNQKHVEKEPKTDSLDFGSKSLDDGWKHWPPEDWEGEYTLFCKKCGKRAVQKMNMLWICPEVYDIPDEYFHPG